MTSEPPTGVAGPPFGEAPGLWSLLLARALASSIRRERLDSNQHVSIPAPNNQSRQALEIISHAAFGPRGREVAPGLPNHTKTAITSMSSIAQATQNPTKTRPIRSKSSSVFNGCLIELQVSLAGRTRTTELSEAGGPRRPNRQLMPARIRSSNLVRGSLHKVSGPLGRLACFRGVMPGSSSGTHNASPTDAMLSVSIQAPSFTRIRRNASAVTTSPSPSIMIGCPFRLNRCSVVNVRGTRLPESCFKSASSGKTNMMFVWSMALTTKLSDAAVHSPRPAN